jgi:hypothetical protein
VTVSRLGEARGARAPDDQLSGFEVRALVRGETVEVIPAVDGEDEQAAGREHAPKLVSPRPLGPFREMREDRNGGDGAEACFGIGQRRGGAVELEARETQVPAAPADRRGVPVAAVKIGVVLPVPDDSPAAAAEVEQALVRAVLKERFADRGGRQTAALEEPLGIRGPCDSHAKPGGGQVGRDATMRAEGFQRLVDAEREPQEQAQKARLSGRRSSSSSTSECAAQLTSQMITTAPT